MKEILAYQEGMAELVSTYKKGKKDEKVLKYGELCNKGPDGKCMYMGSPLYFAFNRALQVDLTQFADDAALIASFRAGTLRGKVQPLESMFGGVTPNPLN